VYFDSEFHESEYRVVRDRQMREIEIEDELLSKAPIRNLRARLYRESFEFVRAQRIHCLHDGAWFINGPLSTGGEKHNGDRKGSLVSNQQRNYRFYRLAANRKYLHFVESSERGLIRAGLDDLPERIDLTLITDIISSTSPPLSSPLRPRNFSFSSYHSPSLLTQQQQQPLSFTLLSSETVLADLIAPDPHTFSEWIDGLALLKKDGNIVTKETAELVVTLCELGIKMKLLDLSGEKVEIPGMINVGTVPGNSEFWYADAP